MLFVIQFIYYDENVNKNCVFLISKSFEFYTFCVISTSFLRIHRDMKYCFWQSSIYWLQLYANMPYLPLWARETLYKECLIDSKYLYSNFLLFYTNQANSPRTDCHQYSDGCEKRYCYTETVHSCLWQSFFYSIWFPPILQSTFLKLYYRIYNLIKWLIAQFQKHFPNISVSTKSLPNVYIGNRISICVIILKFERVKIFFHKEIFARL